MLFWSQMYARYNASISVTLHVPPHYQLTLSVPSLFVVGTPIKSLSLHSNITKLTMGSPCSALFGLMNLVRMKGSILPPHDAREYMPEQTCRFASSWSCLVRQAYPVINVLRVAGLLCSSQLLARSWQAARAASLPAAPIPSYYRLSMYVPLMQEQSAASFQPLCPPLETEAAKGVRFGRSLLRVCQH